MNAIEFLANLRTIAQPGAAIAVREQRRYEWAIEWAWRSKAEPVSYGLVLDVRPVMGDDAPARAHAEALLALMLEKARAAMAARPADP